MHDHDGDRQLLGVLQQIGADPNKPREINFFLVFADEATAGQAKSMLAGQQIDSRISEIPVPWWKKLFAKPSWFVIAARQMTLDPGQIMSMTTLFQQVATRLHGNYDGWEANVMGDQLNIDQMQG